MKTCSYTQIPHAPQKNEEQKHYKEELSKDFVSCMVSWKDNLTI